MLKDRLREGGRVVCLLADRDLTKRGIDVEFFGDTARMPAGPALLAASTGAALLPVGLWFTPGGWGIRIHPEVPIADSGRLRDKVATATQELADAFAADIARRPHDWHMLQRLWLERPARGSRAGCRGRARCRRAQRRGVIGCGSGWSVRTPGTSPGVCRRTSGTWPRR